MKKVNTEYGYKLKID